MRLTAGIALMRSFQEVIMRKTPSGWRKKIFSRDMGQILYFFEIPAALNSRILCNGFSGLKITPAIAQTFFICRPIYSSTFQFSLSGKDTKLLLVNQCRNQNGHLVRGVCSDGVEAAEWIDASFHVIAAHISRTEKRHSVIPLQLSLNMDLQGKIVQNFPVHRNKTGLQKRGEFETSSG